MTGLRSELSFIAERNRINDRKQQQLEQIISQMEDQAASYSTQLIQLQEKLADKDMNANSLEGKLNEKNVRLVEVRAELESALDKNNDLQREVRWNIVSLGLRNIQECSMTYRQSETYNHKCLKHLPLQSVSYKGNLQVVGKVNCVSQ